MYGQFFLSLVLLATIVHHSRSLCFFPVEYLGVYLMQAQADGPFFGDGIPFFSEVAFEPDAVPPWGKCFRRRGKNVILKDNSGGEDCMRCFHLTLKSANIIQIHTESLGKCYTNEEAVRATCPDDRAVHERKFKEITLYRKQPREEEVGEFSSFCPVSGKFRFAYTRAAGNFRCDGTLSEASNCPKGHLLSLRFRQCSFPDADIRFRCLGNWEGPHHEDKYLAVMDLGNPQDTPKLRCGMYRTDPLSGRVFVSLSADSTCHNQLRSPTDGYESFIFTPFPEKSPPGPVLEAHCRFPTWAQGEWEGDLYTMGDLLQYRSGTHRLSLTCLKKEEYPTEGKFTVFTSTHCGEESYGCVWLKRRGENVIEFQMGSRPNITYSDALCDGVQFQEENQQNSWSTRGRVSDAKAFPCPITGDYAGVLPEGPGLCAKVASDCNNPDLMFYTVASCGNGSQILEEREYRCLGSWEENGITFTYTQRRDMPGFQCFSGKVLEDGREAYIKEAGYSCVRGEDPLLYGMKISKHDSCPDSDFSVSQQPLYYSSVRSENIEPSVQQPLLTDHPLWYQKEDDHEIRRDFTKNEKPRPGLSAEDGEDIDSGAENCLHYFLLQALCLSHVLFFTLWTQRL